MKHGTILDQVKLENDNLQRSVDQFNARKEDLLEKAPHNAPGLFQLINNLLSPLAQYFEQEYSKRKKGGYKGNVLNETLQEIPSDHLALLTLRTLVQGVHLSLDRTTISKKLGREVEYYLRFRAFREKAPDYFDTTVKDLNKRSSTHDRHRRAVLTNKLDKAGLKLDSWGAEQCTLVGARIIRIVLNATDVFVVYRSPPKGTSKKPRVRIDFSESTYTWITGVLEHLELTSTIQTPCVYKPLPWDTRTLTGGYHTEEMRTRTPLVTMGINSDMEYYKGKEFPEHIEALNTVQSTGWRVNKRVLNVLEEVWNQGLFNILPRKEPTSIPVSPIEGKDKKDCSELELEQFKLWKREAAAAYNQESTRKSKAYSVSSCIRDGKKFSAYESIYFVHQLDFRGRMYPCTGSLSPQGADFNKALLEFSEGKLIDDTSIAWLSIHAANCWGLDKKSYQQRIDAIDTEEWKQEILRIAENPIANSSWTQADKPFQYLAACFELAEYLRHGQVVSRIPVAMDGTCNGLQHFSAMLRDERGGKSTNLSPASVPSDVYNEVAMEVRKRVQEDNNPLRKHFLQEGVITRKLTKRSVMTLPYGVTKHSVRKYVGEYLQEIHHECTHEDVTFMTDTVWESIGAVIKAAPVAMQWFKRSVREMVKDGEYPEWVSPTGFPVRMKYHKRSRVNLHYYVDDRRYNVRTTRGTKLLDANRIANGVSPNFVHTLDAAHMVKVINELNPSSFAAVHDSFGVHACDVPDLHSYIRSTFYEMYQTDIIENFRVYNGVQEPTPDKGNLDLTEVFDSHYFFS